MRCLPLLLLAVQTCLSYAASPTEWRSRSIYFVMTDRFARTDGSTTAPCNVTAGQYCGGTWQGLINKLDYIKNMGFTAVWITPITHQTEVSNGTQGFHGYWQDDIYSLNYHYGTDSDLKALSAALHSRGMYLMVDVVANHFAYPSRLARDVQYASLNPFNDSKYFHKPCEVDYGNQTSTEVCWIGYNVPVELPDVDTTRQDVKNIYYSWIQNLVSTYGIDGLRVDTVKHVNKDFWAGFNAAAGVYCIGEVFTSDRDYVCDCVLGSIKIDDLPNHVPLAQDMVRLDSLLTDPPDQNYMDGLLNYPLYFPLTNAFKSTSGSMTDLVNIVNDVKSNCKDSTLLGPFLENHDNPRFPSLTSDIAQAKNAIAFTLLADGIPNLYYGQEQHLNGGNDPYDREALWLTGYPTNTELYQMIAKVNQLRNLAISLDNTYVKYQAWPIYSDTTTIAMRKGSDGSSILGVFSNKGSKGAKYKQYIGSNTGFEANSEVIEILTCSKIKTDSKGGITVSMGKGQPKIFYPTAKLANTGICNSKSSGHRSASIEETKSRWLMFIVGLITFCLAAYV